VEIQAMTYGYKRNTLIDNIIYYDYYITNRSANNYHNFRLAQWSDVDLGYSLDDYIGFDSAHRMGICYNGTGDDGASGGYPANSFGRHIPVVGLTMIVVPGDAGTTFAPLGNFDYYNNDASILGNPTNDTQYNYYLRSKLRDGSHFTNDFAGRGIVANGHGAGPDCSYVFPGDPSDTAAWSECNCNNIAGDRKFILTTSDFNLNAGATEHVVMALVATKPDTLNGCPTTTFAGIKSVADTARYNYFNPPLPLPPNAVSIAAVNKDIVVYPSPAHDVLYIEDKTGGNEAAINIMNTIGQPINISIHKTGHKYEADISSLSAGMYLMNYRNQSGQQVFKFIKE
jgi:hypothetical protein